MPDPNKITRSVEADPPSGAFDFWCINVERTDTGPQSGEQRINFYIRDVGDGKTTFDQFQATSSIGGDCTTFPAPLEPFLTFTEGDFRSHN